MRPPHIAIALAGVLDAVDACPDRAELARLLQAVASGAERGHRDQLLALLSSGLQARGAVALAQAHARRPA